MRMRRLLLHTVVLMCKLDRAAALCNGRTVHVDVCASTHTHAAVAGQRLTSRRRAARVFNWLIQIAAHFRLRGRRVN